MTAPPELTAVNPLGNAPVITDGALNLAESGAIVGTSSGPGGFQEMQLAGLSTRLGLMARS